MNTVFTDSSSSFFPSVLPSVLSSLAPSLAAIEDLEGRREEVENSITSDTATLSTHTPVMEEVCPSNNNNTHTHAHKFLPRRP